MPAATQTEVHWHLLEGEAGCTYARKNHCVTIVVDAMRASATAAFILAQSPTQLLVVSEVETALGLKQADPALLLFGERGGLPPDGFDFGNSPQTVSAARARSVVFTTTTGAQRLISSWGSAAVLMGSTVNAQAVVNKASSIAKQQRCDVVVIPAGLATDPTFNAQEDWVASVYITNLAQAPVGIGQERFEYWQRRIHSEGIPELFQSAPHSEKLRHIHLDSDIEFCSRCNIIASVPVALERTPNGVILIDDHLH